MYVLGSKLGKLTVFSLQTGQPISFTAGQIIDPAKLELVAFYVGLPSRKNGVLLAQDVRRLTPDTVVVDSDDALSEPADIVRLQSLLSQKFNLIGLTVETESGQKLGKVYDYVLNLHSQKIHKIHVRPGLLKSIITDNLIIDRNQIVNVTSKKITVRDTTTPKTVMAPNIRAVPE